MDFLDEFDDELSPQDFDDLWEIERLVESINCYTDLLKRIEAKREPLLRF